MNSLFGTLFGYGIPIGASMLISLAAVICMVIALVCPRYIVLGYVAILLLFPNSSSFGMLEGETNAVIYVKGTSCLRPVVAGRARTRDTPIKVLPAFRSAVFWARCSRHV